MIEARQSEETLFELLKAPMQAILAPVTLGLGILFGLVTLIYYFILPDHFQMTIIYCSAGTSIAMFIIAWRVPRSTFVKKFSHLIGFIVAGTVYINCLLLLILSDQVHWASYLAILLIGMGFLLLATRYLIIMYGIIAYTWAAIAIPHIFTPEGKDWIYFSIVLFTSGILGLITHIAHVKLLRRSELLRLETERKNQELAESLQRISRQEETFHDFFENATDLIQLMDKNGKYLYVNRQWKETLGYTDEEVKHLSLKDVVAPDEIEHCFKLLQDLGRHPQALKVETKFLTKDGREIIVEGYVGSRFENGEFVSTRGIFRDMTPRYQAEEKLRRLTRELDSLNKKLALAYQETRSEKDKLASLLDREEMVMLLDSKGIILGISDQALGATGYTRTEILGKSVVDILEPSCRAEVVALLKNGFVGTYHSVRIQFLLTAADFKLYTMGFHRINMLKERAILVIIRPYLKE